MRHGFTIQDMSIAKIPEFALTENQHKFHEKCLDDQKVGICCVVAQSRITGPIFCESTINSLQNISDILEPFFAV